MHSVTLIVEAKYSSRGLKVCSYYQIEKHEPYNNETIDGVKWREELEETGATPKKRKGEELDPQELF